MSFIEQTGQTKRAGQDSPKRWFSRARMASVLLVLLAAATAIISFLPTKDKNHFHTKGRYHSWGHLLVFGVVAFVAGQTVRTAWGRFWLFVASVAFGFGIEAGERLIYGSHMEWKDVLVDAMGVVGGTVIAMIGKVEIK